MAKNKKGYKPAHYTTHEEDKELAKQAMEGNQRAYSILLQKYKPIIYTAASRRLPWYGPEELEDITMIVLGNAFVKIKQYDPEKSKLFTWMVACVHNYVNGIPKQKKRINADSLGDIYGDSDTRAEYEIPDAAGFDEDIDREQFYRLMKMLMNKLTTEQYTVIKMKFFEECTTEEIADALDCSPSLVWYKVQQAKKKLVKLSRQYQLFEE
jgi:RNA polymerase sigma factor (sigma-70 family)